MTTDSVAFSLLWVAG